MIYAQPRIGPGERRTYKLTRKLKKKPKKLWNMKVTFIPIVIGAFRKLTKGMLKRTWKLADEWRPSKLKHY